MSVSNVVRRSKLHMVIHAADYEADLDLRRAILGGAPAQGWKNLSRDDVR